jgi:ketosteroid isomerase-like protein
MLSGMPGTRDVVLAHHAAVNAHDSAGLLAGLAEDVEWSTGVDRLAGRAAVAELFDDGLWALRPELALRRLLVAGDAAAAELVETLTVGGVTHTFPIAAFFTVAAGRLTRVTVYREGSADLPG